MTRTSSARLRCSIVLAIAGTVGACQPAMSRASISPDERSGFSARTIVVGGVSYPYQLYIPRAASSGLPVILSLHGSGERGTDGTLQTMIGLGPVVKGRDGEFPAIVVFPQAPPDSVWAGAPGTAAMRMLDATIAELRADPDRVYLTGISMGGYGTWQLALDHPDRFAALVPVCGGIRPLPAAPTIAVRAAKAEAGDPYAYAAAKLARIPTWVFHGAADRSVPVAESRSMVAALRAAGGDVRYTEYERVGHNSWESAYGEPELWRWLWAQRRTAASRNTRGKQPSPTR
jgi:predicted peptidase